MLPKISPIQHHQNPTTFGEDSRPASDQHADSEKIQGSLSFIQSEKFSKLVRKERASKLRSRNAKVATSQKTKEWSSHVIIPEGLTFDEKTSRNAILDPKSAHKRHEMQKLRFKQG